MIELLRLILHIMASLFKPRAKLVAEILVLRQQLNVLRRQVSKRPQLSNTDRLLFVWLYRWFPSVLSAIAILRPESGQKRVRGVQTPPAPRRCRHGSALNVFSRSGKRTSGGSAKGRNQKINPMQSELLQACPAPERGFSSPVSAAE
jgi:hypothetical protein